VQDWFQVDNDLTGKLLPRSSREQIKPIGHGGCALVWGWNEGIIVPAAGPRHVEPSDSHRTPGRPGTAA
jgi:hypothetical protein